MAKTDNRNIRVTATPGGGWDSAARSDFEKLLARTRLMKSSLNNFANDTRSIRTDYIDEHAGLQARLNALDARIDEYIAEIRALYDTTAAGAGAREDKVEVVSLPTDLQLAMSGEEFVTPVMGVDGRWYVAPRGVPTTMVFRLTETKVDDKTTGFTTEIIPLGVTHGGIGQIVVSHDGDVFFLPDGSDPIVVRLNVQDDSVITIPLTGETGGYKSSKPCVVGTSLYVFPDGVGTAGHTIRMTDGATSVTTVIPRDTKGIVYVPITNKIYAIPHNLALPCTMFDPIQGSKKELFIVSGENPDDVLLDVKDVCRIGSKIVMLQPNSDRLFVFDPSTNVSDVVPLGVHYNWSNLTSVGASIMVTMIDGPMVLLYDPDANRHREITSATASGVTGRASLDTSSGLGVCRFDVIQWKFSRILPQFAYADIVSGLDLLAIDDPTGYFRTVMVPKYRSLVASVYHELYTALRELSSVVMSKIFEVAGEGLSDIVAEAKPYDGPLFDGQVLPGDERASVGDILHTDSGRVDWNLAQVVCDIITNQTERFNAYEIFRVAPRRSFRKDSITNGNTLTNLLLYHPTFGGILAESCGKNSSFRRSGMNNEPEFPYLIKGNFAFRSRFVETKAIVDVRKTDEDTVNNDVPHDGTMVISDETAVVVGREGQRIHYDDKNTSLRQSINMRTWTWSTPLPSPQVRHQFFNPLNKNRYYVGFESRYLALYDQNSNPQANVELPEEVDSIIGNVKDGNTAGFFIVRTISGALHVVKFAFDHGDPTQSEMMLMTLPGETIRTKILDISWPSVVSMGVVSTQGKLHVIDVDFTTMTINDHPGSTAVNLCAIGDPEDVYFLDDDESVDVSDVRIVSIKTDDSDITIMRLDLMNGAVIDKLVVPNARSSRLGQMTSVSMVTNDGGKLTFHGFKVNSNDDIIPFSTTIDTNIMNDDMASVHDYDAYFAPAPDGPNIPYGEVGDKPMLIGVGEVTPWLHNSPPAFFMRACRWANQTGRQVDDVRDADDQPMYDTVRTARGDDTDMIVPDEFSVYQYDERQMSRFPELSRKSTYDLAPSMIGVRKFARVMSGDGSHISTGIFMARPTSSGVRFHALFPMDGPVRPTVDMLEGVSTEIPSDGDIHDIVTTVLRTTRLPANGIYRLTYSDRALHFRRMSLHSLPYSDHDVITPLYKNYVILSRRDLADDGSTFSAYLSDMNRIIGMTPAHRRVMFADTKEVQHGVNVTPADFYDESTDPVTSKTPYGAYK